MPRKPQRFDLYVPFDAIDSAAPPPFVSFTRLRTPPSSEPYSVTLLCACAAPPDSPSKVIAASERHRTALRVLLPASPVTDISPPLKSLSSCVPEYVRGMSTALPAPSSFLVRTAFADRRRSWCPSTSCWRDRTAPPRRCRCASTADSRKRAPRYCDTPSYG